MRGLVLAVVLTTSLVSCGDTKITPEASAPQPSQPPDTGQVVGPAPTQQPTTTAIRANALGTEVRTALGNTVTVYAYQPVPMERSFPAPASGTAYAAVDVGGCISTGNEGPDPQYFELVMPDSSRLRPSFPLKLPALRPTRLVAGECIRGWITYEVPVTSRPQVVVFNATSLVRWTIP